MHLHRVVVSWQGPQVQGAAVNVLHFDATEQPVPPVAAIRAAYATLAAAIPTNVNIQVPGSGETIDDATGELVGVWATAAPAVVSGTGGTIAPAGVGMCVTWLTGGIVNGRRLRGRTFIVPIPGPAFDADGTIGPGALGALSAFATGMVGAGGLGVWHRPTTSGGTDGTSSGVLGFRIRDKVAYLSSRRD